MMFKFFIIGACSALSPVVGRIIVEEALDADGSTVKPKKADTKGVVRKTHLVSEPWGIPKAWSELNKTLVFTRHGESAWNVKDKAWSKLWKSDIRKRCQKAKGETIRDEYLAYCKADHRVKAALQVIRSNISFDDAPEGFEEAAEEIWKAREMVDAPLTEKGLAGAAEFSKQFDGGLKLPEDINPKEAALVMSNVMRAADTLTTCYDKLVDSAKEGQIYIANCMQEYSSSGVPDVVAGILPTLFAGTESKLAKLAKQYRDEACEKAQNCKNLTWYKDNALPLGAEGVVNTDLYYPNEALEAQEPDNVRRISKKDPALSNVSKAITSDYPPATGQIDFVDTERFPSFLRGIQSLETYQTVIAGGHSNWFMSFVASMIKRGILTDESCKPLARTVVDNLATVIIRPNGKCSCLYPGQSKLDKAKKKGEVADTAACLGGH